MGDIIIVKHLTKRFGNLRAVNNISFKVEKGELFGFLGVNGAGKSTTINMLCTLFPPTSGEVIINGMTLGKDNEAIKRHIGVVYQNNCLDDRLTVKENLMLRGGLYETEERRLIRQLNNVCEILDLQDVLKRPFGKLSGGQKRRCEIARALMHTPEILFLDEPTTGLDPATRKSVWETVSNLQKELNTTVFLTTHYMEEAAKANHIAILDQGKLIEYGTPFSLKEEFASDQLQLIPKDTEMENLLAQIAGMGLRCKRKEERLAISIGSTMSAIELINTFANRISGFEVVQGTMDDVFLNATGGERA